MNHRRGLRRGNTLSRMAVLLPLCLLALAVNVPAAAARKKPTAEPRSYIETSYLVAPRQIEDFQLEAASYTSEQKYSGAGFRYALKGHQEIRLDIYVYPAGRMTQAEALDAGMKAFRDDLQLAVERGSYSQLQELEQTSFALTPPATASQTPENDFDAEVLKAIAQAVQVTGRKLQLAMTLQPNNWRLFSNGYLFHKQLYYVKLRASAAQERISREEFNALTDHAARTLIPAIAVANIGECANTTLYLPSGASAEESALALVRQSALHKGHNCYLSAKDAKVDARRETAEIIEISYSAQEWKSQ